MRQHYLLYLISLSAATMLEMSPRIVFTKQGPVQGFIGPRSNTPLYYGGGNYGGGGGGRPAVEIFLGIPYASPPTGPSHRFESPAPVQPRSRTEVFIANVSHPPCPHHPNHLKKNSSTNLFKELRRTMEYSLESCLYLDIYAPLNSVYYNSGRGGKGLLGVLVFMNQLEEDEEMPWDGSSFAAVGNLILISVRYRVGVLGFLQPGYAEDVRSNFGLWDQLAALQWIKENIEEFGGDPGTITLMGYEQDGTNAGLLALSPASQAYNGLFNRLILLNSSPFAPNALALEPIRSTYQLAHALPCPTVDEKELKACLRRMPVGRMLAAAEKVGAPLLTHPFSPVADGFIVPLELTERKIEGDRRSEEMLRKVDLLVGLRDRPVLPKNIPLLSSLDLSRFVTAAIKVGMRMEGGAEPTEDVKMAVMKALMEDQGYGTYPSIAELLSDFLTVSPIIELLNAHSSSASGGRNTFFYVFKGYDPLELSWNDELGYLFSSKVYEWKYGSMNKNNNLQPFLMLINLLANFVRNGDPNVSDPTDRFGATKSTWPKYNEVFSRYLEISSDVQFPSGYRKQQTEWWGKSFFSIIKSFKNGSSVVELGFPPPHHHHRPPPPPPPTNKKKVVREEDKTSFTFLGASSPLIVIGCALLLLNFLCFLGLFYQRERLKKAELQLRRSYEQVRGGGGAENHVSQEPMRETNSEPETENGFGAHFLSPNYDPRTKVNRWMQMQTNNTTPDYDQMQTNNTTPDLYRIPMQINKIVPKATPEPPVQFIPQLPYRAPYTGPNERIPYADSRATSPSTITSAPGCFVSRLQQQSSVETALPPPNKGILSSTTGGNKRSSTLIVRELEEEEAEPPKYVPVKMGTLKRSVGVDTDHDSILEEEQEGWSRGKREQVRVTFKESF